MQNGFGISEMIVKSRTISNAALALVLSASLTAAPITMALADTDSSSSAAAGQTSAPSTIVIDDYDWAGSDELNDQIAAAAKKAKIDEHETVVDFLDGKEVSTAKFMKIDVEQLAKINTDFAKFVEETQADLQKLIDADTATDPVTPVEPVTPESDAVEETVTEEVVVEDAPEDAVAEREDHDEDEIVYVSRNLTTEQFIETIGEDARELCQDSDLYASVMIAQAIVESASGSSGLSCEPYNNLFGIKGSYKGSSVRMKTQEDDGAGNYSTITAEFRKYPSLKDSLSDYVDLLTSNSIYSNVFKSKCESYEDACEWLQGRYATSTTYAKTLKAYIEAYNLTEYDSASDQPKLEKVSGSPSLTTTSNKSASFGGDSSDLGVVVPDEGLPESNSVSPIVAGLLASGAALIVCAAAFFLHWRRKQAEECVAVGRHANPNAIEDAPIKDKSGISSSLRALQDEAALSSAKATRGKHAGAEKTVSESATTGSLPPLKFVDDDIK